MSRLEHLESTFPQEECILITLDHQPSLRLEVAKLLLHRGQTYDVSVTSETAWILMHGEIEAHFSDRTLHVHRKSLFDDAPSCVHVPAGTSVSFVAHSNVELTRYSCDSSLRFTPRSFLPHEVRQENRGERLVGGTCHRIVRTIFDRENSENNVALVLGEVVAPPGHWSSYPPHHHDQPEIYHYRFDPPSGFGFSQLGDDALIVRHEDTVPIVDGVDHAQAAAPGYAMYYSWVIRHLPDRIYQHPVFADEHQWILNEHAQVWRPKPLPQKGPPANG